MAPVEPRPGGARARPRTDAALRGFARLVLGSVFRDVDLVGADNLPKSGAVMVIANHSNSIIDGGVLLAFLPRIPRFLAASTVWDYKPVAPFMNASGAVKVFRKQDGRAHEGSLEDSFADAAALLADGGVLAIFPEGRTHDDPAMLPFKTGAARIAAFTQDRHGPLDLAIVPVGVDYEVKNLFRTRVCFTFGPPVTLRPKVLAAPGVAGGADGVRWATGKLRKSLRAVAPDFATRDEAEAMALGGEILARSEAGKGGVVPSFGQIVTARHRVRDALARADAAGAREGAAKMARSALGGYAKRLADAGLADRDVANPSGRTARARAALALLPGLPVLLLAALLNGPQARLLQAIARTKPRDRQMTWMTFGGIVFYPLTWILWAVVLGLTFGALAGAGWGWGGVAATLVAAPLSARLALPALDRVSGLRRALRAARLLNDDGDGDDRRDRLVKARARAVAVVEQLVAAHPPGGGG